MGHLQTHNKLIWCFHHIMRRIIVSIFNLSIADGNKNILFIIFDLIFDVGTKMNDTNVIIKLFLLFLTRSSQRDMLYLFVFFSLFQVCNAKSVSIRWYFVGKKKLTSSKREEEKNAPARLMIIRQKRNHLWTNNNKMEFFFSFKISTKTQRISLMKNSLNVDIIWVCPCQILLT